MKLKLIVKKLEDVPEAFRACYVASGDEFVLQTDGNKDVKKRIDEFRNTNIDLQKKLDLVKDIDPAKYEQLKKLAEELDANEDMKLIKDGKIDEVVSKRTEAMRKDYDKKLTDAASKINQLTDGQKEFRTGYEELYLERQLMKAVGTVAKIRDGAIDDVLMRAKRVWKMNEDKELIAVNGAGEPILGKKGTDPLTMGEFVTDLVDTAGFLFEGPVGGGARGGKLPSGTPGVGVKRIDASNPVEMGKHMKGLADGSVVAVMPAD